VKICLIGDSQLGALKLAIDQGLVETGGHDIAFFAAVAGKALKFRLVDNAIQPGAVKDISYSTQGAFAQVNPSAFDALVFYGTGLTFGNWMRPEDASLEPTENYTPAFLAACAQARIVRSTCFKLAEAVASAPGWPRRLFICPSPARSAPLGNRPEGNALLTLDALNTAASECATLIGAQYVPQPTATLAPGFYTQAEFSIGSRRFIANQPAHPIAERNHMNAAYGALMLRDILAALN